MKALLLSALAATVVLTGCNAMTATADKIMDKKSSFSQEANTAYPIGEGPYDADTKNEAALEDMRATQAVGGQYPSGVKTDAAEAVVAPAGAEAAKQ